jgi:hypothetical protein
MKWALAALTAVLLIGWFSPELSDTDFWWHLRTGQYISEHHSLPVPDPFAYTTASAGEAYSGEGRTRYFNLTHEWLAQVIAYAVYRAAGFGGVVAFRALLLTAFCGIAGFIVYRRTQRYYASLACALASAGVAAGFAVDRPYILTYVCLALTILILETGGRWLWALPPLFLFWANCHGGFFLGWIAVAAYVAQRRSRTGFVAGALAILASGVNPNGFRVPFILASYRASYMQSRLLEWAAPSLWPPNWFVVLLFAGAAILVWARRKVRLADWLLFGAFAAAAISAARNEILIGFFAPVVIATYLPDWKIRPRPWLPLAAAAAVSGALVWGSAGGSFFRFRVNSWKWPSGAADFLLSHRMTEPMFNTYEYGGYLMWRLWPQERVFIDGRALSESVFMDYARILYNHDATGGKSADELLRQYGVGVIVMNGFEYVSGNVYLLAPSLADPRQTQWKLVYSGPEALIFMRHPPAGVEALPPLRVLDHLEAECDLHIRHEPQYPRCARSLGQVFLKIGDPVRARRWIGTYLRLHRGADPEAEDAFRRLMGAQ